MLLKYVRTALCLPHGLALLYALRNACLLLPSVFASGFEDIFPLSLLLLCCFVALASGIYIADTLLGIWRFALAIACVQAGLGGIGLVFAGNTFGGTAIALLYGMTLYSLKRPMP